MSPLFPAPPEPFAGSRANLGNGHAATLARHASRLLSSAAEIPGHARGTLVREHEAAVKQAAQALGLLQPSPFSGHPPLASGQEHSIWFDEAGQRVWKATHPGRWGLAPGRSGQSTPLSYLIRMCLVELVFSFPWALWAVSQTPHGQLQILSTQPVAEGDPASEEQISTYLENADFELHEEGFTRQWINPVAGLVVEDAWPDNIAVTPAGVMLPFDVPIGFHHRDSEAQFLAWSPTKESASSPTGYRSP